MKYRLFLYISALFAVAFASCSDEDKFETSENSDEQTIIFHCQTLSTRGASPVDVFGGTAILRTEEGRDSLFMHGEISDWEPATTRGAITNSVSTFNVTCVRKDNNGDPQNYYFKDQTYNYSIANSKWQHKDGAVYYWTGTAQELYDFYAYVPETEGAVVNTPESPGAPTIHYAVASTEADQKDLLACSSPEYPGNWGKTVDLEFDHLLTAVQFKMGDDMASGFIEGIRLSGVAVSGTYDMVTKQWSLDEGTQTVSLSKQTASTAGAVFNDDSNSFLLLPQALDNVEVTILYRYTQTSELKELKSSLSGLAAWEAGKKVVYTFTITPQLTIGIADVQDAHYTMVEVPFEVVGCGTSGKYTLTVSCDDGGSWAKMRTNRVGPETSGYWISNTSDYTEFNRTTTITGTGDGKKSVWVFLEENATDAPRYATFTLSTAKARASVKIKQLNPSWTGPSGTGWERLESEETYPFGFNWTRKVTYSGKGIVPGILYYLLNWFGGSSDLVTFTTEGGILNRTYYIIIDYSQANELGDATTDTNGKANTWTLYEKAGFSLDSFEKTLDGYSSYFSKKVEGSTEKTDNYAALIALKCNPFTVEKNTDQGQTAYKVTITEDQIKWFLAAPDQFDCADTEYPMNGNYWSSNASSIPISNKRAAYYVPMTNNTASTKVNASREGLHKVRALRIAKKN